MKLSQHSPFTLALAEKLSPGDCVTYGGLFSWRPMHGLDWRLDSKQELSSEFIVLKFSVFYCGAFVTRVTVNVETDRSWCESLNHEFLPESLAASNEGLSSHRRG